MEEKGVMEVKCPYESKLEIFFGENGLTSTSANYIANKAKELYEGDEQFLSNICFVNRNINLVGGESTSLTEGCTEDGLAEIRNAIDRCGKLKSLIAWLREAIKARARMANSVTNLCLREYLANAGIENKSIPAYGPALTEDGVLATMSVKDRNAYYRLEAEAANIGKLIHPDGALAKARKEMHDRMHNPNSISGEGRDMVITTYVPSVDSHFVDDLFLELEEKHRSIQARLNGIKHAIEVAIDEDKVQKRTKYTLEYSEYDRWLSGITNEFNSWQEKELSRIRDLKIIIPKDLQQIYEEVAFKKGTGE